MSLVVDEGRMRLVGDFHWLEISEGQLHPTDKKPVPFISRSSPLELAEEENQREVAEPGSLG